MAFNEKDFDFGYSIFKSQNTSDTMSDSSNSKQLVPYSLDPISSITSGNLYTGQSDYGISNPLIPYPLSPSWSIPYNGISDFGNGVHFMPYNFDPNLSITSGTSYTGMSDFSDNKQFMLSGFDPNPSITSGTSYTGTSDFSDSKQFMLSGFDPNSSITSLSSGNECFATNEMSQGLESQDFLTEDCPQFDFGLPWSESDDGLDDQEEEEAKPTDPQPPAKITQEEKNIQRDFGARYLHHMQGPRGVSFTPGVIRTPRNGGMEVWDPSKKSWRPAVYHKEIREHLIASSGPENSFELILQARMGKTTDITSYHPLYWNRREDRNHWPEILYQYLPTDEDLKKPKALEWVLDDGRVVIDCINHIMYDFPTLPKTIASNVPGWLLIAFMRSNLNIHMQDIRGRMVNDVPSGNKDDPLGHNKLSMRISRFRKLSGCLIWYKSAMKKDPLKEYMDRILPTRCLEANSTKSFRYFYPHELREIEVKLLSTHKKLRMKNMTTKDFDGNRVKKAKSSTLVKQKVSKKCVAGVARHVNAKGNEIDDTKSVATKSKEVSITDVNHTPVYQSQSRHEAPYKAPDPSLTNNPSREPMNYLATVPLSKAFKDEITYLLTPTRCHFRAITEQYPPISNDNLCYNDQVSEMQETFAAWHVGNQRFGKPLDLVRLNFLNDKVALWSFPWVEDLFGSRLILTRTEQQCDGVEWF